MNQAHLHLILVHIPVVLTPVAALTLALGLMRKQSTTVTIAHSFLVAATLFCIPAFLLGEGAEELVEHLPGISEDTIEEHEEVAEVTVWISGFLGLCSLVSLMLRNRMTGLHFRLQSVILALAFAASGFLAYTAYEGGKIRHPEAYGSPAGETDK